MENNSPLELTFDKPEDFLTQEEKISQVLKVVEGLKDLENKYAGNPEMLDQIQFRLGKQKETLAKLGYEEPKLDNPSIEVADYDQSIGAQERKVNNKGDAWKSEHSGETLH